MQPESNVTLPVSPLRARSFWEIVSASFAVYRDNFWTVLGVSALTLFPLFTGNYLLNTASRSSRGAVGLSACFGTLFLLIVTITLATILNGMVTQIASETQFGNRLSLQQAWQQAKPRFRTLAGSIILVAILLGGLTFISLILTALCGVAIVLLAITLYFSITIGYFYVPVVMLEEWGETASIDRAMRLAQGRFWNIVGLAFVYGVIGLLLGFLVGILFLSGRVVSGAGGGFLVALVTAGISVLIAPLLPIGMTLLYYDTRIRYENMDSALNTVGPNARPKHAYPTLPRESLWNSQALINMGILVALSIVGYLLLRTALLDYIQALPRP